MNARVQQLLQNVRDFFVALPPPRRYAILGVGVASVLLVLGLAWWVQRPLFRPLFTNLSQDDAGRIVQALRDEKVEYVLDDGGRAILVPAERLYELRLALASRGLPEGGGVGFELFDRQTLGQTDFLQHLNYQRALQGELARTISELGGVESARVHLALPERSLFVSQDRRPSASVVVKLAPGRALSRAQIDGIVNLVAASVEGMDPDGVTVVDEAGRMLTPDRGQGLDDGAASGTALEYQRALERSTEERVESLLGAIVGRGAVVARVAAKLDFSRAERTEERFDPDGAVPKQEQRRREETNGAPAPGGIPGTQSNLTNEVVETNMPSGPTTERREESVTYEISKMISRTIAPVGALERLSVAVVVDGTYTDVNGTRTFQPRSQEELDRYTELVKSAVGFNEDRGDQIQVISAPFQEAPEGSSSGVMSSLGRWAPVVLTRILGVAFVAFALLYVVRPLLLALAVRRDSPAAQALRGGDVQAALTALTQENLLLTQQHPERAAQLVREWLQEDAETRTA
jgi:flagellar M-ring protein FliF